MENINKKILIKRITELAKDKGISVHTAFVESGAGKNFKSNLATANPSLGKITLIANYLNTTVEYLLGETDIKEKALMPTCVSESDMELLAAYHSKPEMQEAVKKLLGLSDK